VDDRLVCGSRDHAGAGKKGIGLENVRRRPRVNFRVKLDLYIEDNSYARRRGRDFKYSASASSSTASCRASFVKWNSNVLPVALATPWRHWLSMEGGTPAAGEPAPDSWIQVKSRITRGIIAGGRELRGVVDEAQAKSRLKRLLSANLDVSQRESLRARPL
jgi:hypothetical protein